MKKFDQRWKECAARARTGSPELISMPFGFDERVLRRCAHTEPSSFSAERLWLRFGLRTLAGVSAVLIVISTLYWNLASRTQLLRPPIEHSIVDYSGLL